MGREIRMVPANWEHPKKIRQTPDGDLRVEYRPLLQTEYYTFESSVEEWEKDRDVWLRKCREWMDGYYYDFDGNKLTVKEALQRARDSVLYRHNELGEGYLREELGRYQTGHCSFAEFWGEMEPYPSPEIFMPYGDWYQLFETVSDGTPLSPPFATEEELIDWLVYNIDFWGHEWTREQAELMLKQKYSYSMYVIRNEDGTYNAYDSQESLTVLAGERDDNQE